MKGGKGSGFDRSYSTWYLELVRIYNLDDNHQVAEMLHVCATVQMMNLSADLPVRMMNLRECRPANAEEACTTFLKTVIFQVTDNRS